MCVCAFLFVLTLEHRCTIKKFGLSKNSKQTFPTKLSLMSQIPSQCNRVSVPRVWGFLSICLLEHSQHLESVLYWYIVGAKLIDIE